MRLLIISNLFWPDHAGGASIYTDFATAMAARGHQVTVRCAYSYFPEWKDKTGENSWRVKRERHDGVDIERYGLLIPRSPQGLRARLLFEGSHLTSLARSLPRGKFDAALVFATHPSSTGFGALLNRLRKMPLWINVQDLASDAARATGLLESSRSDRVIQRIDELMLGRANVLSGLSPGMVDRLRELCPGADVRYLPNWLHRSMAEHVAATDGM
ncbi:MAG: glycosyltransferase, partial [Actinobacteria bacterium]|nr:glycosyltransferase [Actinomycetota bacterium]